MPTAQISFDTTAWDSWLKLLGMRMKSKGADFLQAAWLTIGFKDIIEHFEKEEGPNGVWPIRAFDTNRRYDKISRGEWSPPKGMRKGSFKSSNKLLQLTGTLKKSLLRGGSVSKKGHDAIIIQSPVEYSGTHEYGDNKRNIPARSFMWLSASAMDKMANFFLEMLTKD